MKIVQAWLVIVLAVCFGGALAGVQLQLGPRIEQNKINETLKAVPELILGSDLAAKMAAENQKLDITPRLVGVEKAGRKTLYKVYAASYQGDLRGWVAKTAGQGYADKIELLLGFDPRMDTITGLFVLDQKETPGLGNKIITEKWRRQFIDKEIATPLAAVKSKAQAANEIDAITGATISSKSVVRIINTAAGDLRTPLREGPAKKSKDKG